MKPLSVAIGSLVAASLLLAAPGAVFSAEVTPDPKAASAWIWPLPPEKPRVRHLQTVITPQDLGVTKGFFQKIWEFIAGEETAERVVVPHGVASDGEGRVYVVDWGAARVHFFDFKKKKYDVLTKTKSGPFLSPIGIALDDDGMVYVSDSVLRRVFVLGGMKQKRVIGDDTLQRPTGIAINRKEKRLYVVDTTGHRVDVFDLEGKKQFSFGGQGASSGKFNYPTHVAVDGSGDVYVMDSLNFRVQIFDKTGKFLSQFGGTGTGIQDFMKPKGIAVDSEGHVWVSDSYRNTIQVFDRKGRLLLIFGKLGIGQGQFNVPEGLCMDSKDRLFVADSYNYRIQMFQYLKADAGN